MTRWLRAATDLRHALTGRSHLLRPSPTTTALFSRSTTTSTPSKSPRKSKSTQPPPPQRSPKSWVTFNAASAHMDKIMLEDKDERDEMKDVDVELDEGRWPKPIEIPWQAKVANCVNLIGHVMMPVQFLSDDDGKKSWACSMIRQESSSKSNPLWITVLFEGDLAHVVACHVKENDYVYVTGHLSAEPLPFRPSTSGQPLQVIVENINFVDESTRIQNHFSHSKRINGPTRKNEASQDDGDVLGDNASIKQSWRDLLLKPHEWWDIRSEKGSAKGAAFKRKDTGELLLIDESTPQWLLRKLECLSFDHQLAETEQQNASRKTNGRDLGPWKDLLDDSSQWRDYRKDKLDGKVHAKHPDFKRKDRSVSLWLNSAPKTIISELDNLEFGVPRPSPQQADRSKEEESWKELVKNPHKWWDNRLNKQSEKGPDFTHKDTKESLWLNRAPKSILSALENVDFGTQTPLKGKKIKGEEFWKDVVENPHKWWDNRVKKLSNKSPDFKHKETGEVLWLSSAPTWALSKLPPSNATPSFGNQNKETMSL